MAERTTVMGEHAKRVAANPPVQQVKDPMIQMRGFIDSEGDPEADLEAREAEAAKQAQGAAEGDSGPNQGTPEAPPEGEQPPEGEEAPAEGEEQPEQQAAEPEPEKRQKKPWERVKELRDENKALAERLRAVEAREQQRAEAEQRYQQQLEQQRLAQQQGQQPQYQIPEYQDDPLGHLNARLQLAEAHNQLTQQQVLLNRVVSRIDTEERGFQQEHNDYYTARDYLIQQVFSQQKAMGLSDQEAVQALELQRQVLIAAAFRQGRSVAEVVYQLAEANGYQAGNGQQTNGKPGAQERVQNAVARERQAQAALGNVSNAPGRTPQGLKRGMIEKMSEAELEKLDRERPGWADELTRD